MEPKKESSDEGSREGDSDAKSNKNGKGKLTAKNLKRHENNERVLQWIAGLEYDTNATSPSEPIDHDIQDLPAEQNDNSPGSESEVSEASTSDNFLSMELSRRLAESHYRELYFPPDRPISAPPVSFGEFVRAQGYLYRTAFPPPEWLQEPLHLTPQGLSRVPWPVPSRSQTLPRLPGAASGAAAAVPTHPTITGATPSGATITPSIPAEDLDGQNDEQPTGEQEEAQ
ncbi:hypothetical protein ABKA04_006507 [Annulohypoxylon sp. FPYF3050]